MAKKPCKCPGQKVWERGRTREEAWAPNQAAANAALPGLIAGARAAAEKAVAAAMDAALKTGDQACEAGCEAWFKAAPLDGPWTAVGAVSPYNRWLARAGFTWEVLVKCEKPEKPEKPKEKAAVRRRG